VVPAAGRFAFVAFEGLFTVCGTICIDRGIQRGQIRRRRLLNLYQIELPLVGVGLQVGAVGVEQAAGNAARCSNQLLCLMNRCCNPA
jgi:hypothetical protein